jgi:hypothetical protein
VKAYVLILVSHLCLSTVAGADEAIYQWNSTAATGKGEGYVHGFWGESEDDRTKPVQAPLSGCAINVATKSDEIKLDAYAFAKGPTGKFDLNMVTIGDGLKIPAADLPLKPGYQRQMVSPFKNRDDGLRTAVRYNGQYLYGYIELESNDATNWQSTYRMWMITSEFRLKSSPDLKSIEQLDLKISERRGGYTSIPTEKCGLFYCGDSSGPFFWVPKWWGRWYGKPKITAEGSCREFHRQ